MVSGVSQNQIVQKTLSTDNKTTKASIFYVNDVHSNITNMPYVKSASDSFDSSTSENGVDKLKFSAGDFCLGQGVETNKFATAVQNSMGLMATVEGNHEFDLQKNEVVDVLKDNNLEILGLNVDIPQTSDANKAISKEISKSYIQEVNGTKYGVIGLMPFDFNFHVTDANAYKDFSMIPLEKTVGLVQAEIDNLKKQGVNKIIVLSHVGYEADKKIAQSVEGIDIIIGGHSHDLIEGVQEGKNLFYSKKTGEPTLITQAGKDGNYFGVLNVEFDQNGVIKTAQNNVTKTEGYSKSLIVNYFADKFLGKAQKIGYINSVEKHAPTLVKENPSSDFILDAMRSELGTDLALQNSANIRSKFEVGTLTDRDLSALSPFHNKMYIVKLTEPEVVNAVKVGAKSLTASENLPGLLQVSGLRYTITKSGELKELSFVDKAGKETRIDVNNPNPFKSYTAAEDYFMVRGGNGYLSNKLNDYVQKFDYDNTKNVTDYLKKANKPVDIKTDGRITIV